MPQTPVRQHPPEDRKGAGRNAQPSSDARGVMRILSARYPVGDCTFGSLAHPAPDASSGPAAFSGLRMP
jgi:hypothetical protein